jgi:Tfp pilus assembly protein PilF
MTELEFVAAISRHWPRRIDSPEPTAATLELLDQAVVHHPFSARLWTMRGCLLQLASDASYPLNESAQCFKRAIRLDPSYADAYDEMGHFLDAVMGNPRKAKRYFVKARLLRRASAKLT